MSALPQQVDVFFCCGQCSISPASFGARLLALTRCINSPLRFTTLTNAIVHRCLAAIWRSVISTHASFRLCPREFIVLSSAHFVQSLIVYKNALLCTVAWTTCLWTCVSHIMGFFRFVFGNEKHWLIGVNPWKLDDMQIYPLSIPRFFVRTSRRVFA